MNENNYSFATAVKQKVQETDVKTASGIKCPHCGATIHEDDEICPSCGKRLVSYCTFCGAQMDWSDSECPECGAPADGIECPSCGTLCFRSFCPRCNSPVTKAAVRMVEAAKKDPLFAEVVQQNQKKEELESELEKAPADKVFSIKKELIKVTNNLNLTLSQMLPPAGSTPQEQRNYFSARKVAVTTKNVKQLRLCWICNYCGCAHSHPSDCVKPYLGGKWEYETVTTDYTEYVKK